MIRKPTITRRRYIDQRGRVIVPPEKGAAPSSVRRVHISLPDNAETLIAIGPNDEKIDGDLPVDRVEPTLRALGEGQPFMLAPVVGGTNYKIEILSQQWIIAAVKRGDAVLGVTIEYIS